VEDEANTIEKEEVMTERLWDAEEVARFLGLAVGTIYHLVSQQRIPFVRLSARCLRFQPRAIDAWVEEKAVCEGEADNFTEKEKRRNEGNEEGLAPHHRTGYAETEGLR